MPPKSDNSSPASDSNTTGEKQLSIIDLNGNINDVNEKINSLTLMVQQVLANALEKPELKVNIKREESKTNNVFPSLYSLSSSIPSLDMDQGPIAPTKNNNN